MNFGDTISLQVKDLPCLHFFLSFPFACLPIASLQPRGLMAAEYDCRLTPCHSSFPGLK